MTITKTRASNYTTMKTLQILRICAAGILLLANLALAETVQFKGQVVDEPCNLSMATVNQIVDLGKVPAVTLNRNGPITPVPFEITLENCTIVARYTENIFRIQLSDDPINEWNQVITTGGTNAAIRIQNSTHDDVILGDTIAEYPIVPGSRTFHFFAVVEKEHDKISVIPGEFTAMLWIDIFYL
ncbi:fimbrial protein [Buttiauxella ferragutiae]|uniref:fimbrial protein n=1 Tax=Buttiauxella ferragutiae TaxID=82989 RepID=UPI003523BAA8